MNAHIEQNHIQYRYGKSQFKIPGYRAEQLALEAFANPPRIIKIGKHGRILCLI